MTIPLLNDIVIIFGLSVAIVFVCSRFKIPSIVGFILTGILSGPHGFGLIKTVSEVDTLAEIGIVLLLFTIGIEFSLKNLFRIKKSVLAGGSLQVLLTVTAAFLIVWAIRQTLSESVFIGFLVSLSSTAIVLKLLQERAEIDSPHGQTSLGILIFQDVIIVPMLLCTPLLAGAAGNVGESILILLAKGIAIILLVIISARWIIPWVLYKIARTRSRELFLLSIVVICLGVAWLTSSAGLSLALGAFLAGLIISESEYSHHALGNILPFRDVFTSLFFVSMGMLLDIGFLMRQPVLIVTIVLGVLVLKTTIAGLVTILLGFPIRTAILVGFSISQVGEFSFILSRAGVEYGLLTSTIYQLFLSVSVLTMMATPFITALAPRVATLISRLPMPGKLKSGLSPVRGKKKEDRKDHLIIIGFGISGRNLAQASKASGIPYVIIEMNPKTVKDEKAKGEPIYYGDATHEAVLQYATLKNARVVVVAINDPAATRRITEVIRQLNPIIDIIVRTPYLHELKSLYALGANEVIPEEFETSIEIFTRVLSKYLVPRAEIERFVAEVRSGGYKMFRSLSKDSTSFSTFKHFLSEFEISALRVGEKSPAVGKSLAQIELRKKYEVTVLAIRRDSEVVSNPSGDMQLCTDDVLFVLGLPDKIINVTVLFQNQGGTAV